MRVITFNANGIRSGARLGFFDWMNKVEADLVCIQETKAHVNQLQPESLYFPQEYYCEYVEAEKKGYSGVAIYSRKKPLQVIKKVGYELCDTEGRYLRFDYPNLSVISAYLPSGTSGSHRQVLKFECLDWFGNHLSELLKQGRELVVCGDFNIAHQKRDLKNWRGNQKNSGFLPEERAWLDELFGQRGYFDAFREINQEEGQYTWWPYRAPHAWEKNVGWRIDYQVISQGLKDKVVDARVYRDQKFSDHAPLIIDYEGDGIV